MELDELHDHELLAMVVLAKAMVHADGVVSKDEMLDLLSLGEAIGMKRFQAALDACKDLYKSGDEVVRIAATVQRYDARVLLFVLLEELAKGDGADQVEKRFLADLRRFWKL